MAGEKINLDYITQYLHQVLPSSTGIFRELEEEAAADNIPIIHPEVAALLKVLCKLKKPERILEVGTAIGYSALCLAGFLPERGRLITIERDPDMAQRARSNISRAGMEAKIRVIEGEALEVLSCLHSQFDLIFMDAAKGYYLDFFQEVERLAADGALLISDNVLYKGMTATDELVKRRQKTIVGRMREYLTLLCHHKRLTTSIIPIGDGVALSYFEEGK